MQTIKILINSIQIRIQDFLWRLLISIVLSSRGFLTLLSSYLEFTLDLIHSFFFFSILDTFTTNPITTSRAWWDNKKGSAIVIYAPNLDNQNATSISTSIALRLASLDPTQPQPLSLLSPTSFFSRLPFSSSKTFQSSGSPPYTCLVILPNEQSITPLITAWAERKAQLQRSSESKSKRKAANRSSISKLLEWIATSLTSLIFWEEKEELADRETEVEFNDNASNWEASSNFTFEEEVTPKNSPDKPPVDLGGSPTVINRSRSSSSVSNRRGNVSSPTATGLSSAPKKPKKRSRRRSISWGGWTAPDIVGFGRDMVKGLKIGQSGRRGMGSVIPIVVNMNQSPEALTFARSTIQGYCSGHDLLLRGLIIVPSILSPKTSSNLTSTPSQSLGISSLPSWDARPASDDASGSGYSSLPFAHAQPPISRHRSGSHLRPLTSANLAGVSDRHASPNGKQPPPTPSSQTSNHHSNSPPLSPRSSFYHLSSIKRNNLLDQALRTDVTETLGLVDTLLPTLRRDAGRIVALVPSGWGDSILRDPKLASSEASSGGFGTGSELSRGRTFDTRGSSIGLYEHTPSPPPFAASSNNEPTEGLIFSAVRESLKIMWKQKKRDLKRDGVKISLIFSAPIQSQSTSQDLDLPPFLQSKRSTINSRNENDGSRRRNQPSSPKNSLPWISPSNRLPKASTLSSLVHNVLETLYFISNPASHLLNSSELSRSKISKSKPKDQTSRGQIQFSPNLQNPFDQSQSQSKDDDENQHEPEEEFVSSFQDRRSTSDLLKGKERSSKDELAKVEDEEVEKLSPLFEAILSSLSRSRPRSKYVNGLGPRFEDFSQEIVGARFIREVVGAWLRG